MDRIGIRQAVVDALMNNTSAADRVFRTKHNPVEATKTPAIAVYVNRSTGRVNGGHLLAFNCTHEVMVECYGARFDDWDDQVDSLVDECEEILFKDPDRAIWKCGTIIGYSVDLAVQDGGEAPITCARMGIEIQTQESFDPSEFTPLDDLLKVHIDVDQQPVDADIDVSAELDIPQ